MVCENWTVFIPWCERPLQFSSHNYSRLHCLITLAQIAEGKKLIEPAEVSIKKEEEVYFLDQEYSGLYDDKVLEYIECYLNLPETSHHISQLEQQDKQLLALQVNNSNNWVNLQLDDNLDDIIGYKKDLVQPNWKNCVAQINGRSYYQMVLPNDETSWWEKDHVRHWTNIIIIPSFGICHQFKDLWPVTLFLSSPVW